MNNIAKIRRSRKWSQADLAAQVGVEQPTISRIEKGSTGVTLKVLGDIAEALEVDLYELFDSRNEAEAFLLRAFRSLPEGRQQGWVDMAKAAISGAIVKSGVQALFMRRLDLGLMA